MNISAACAEALQSLLYPLVIRVRIFYSCVSIYIYSHNSSSQFIITHQVPFITTLPSQLRSTITDHKSCLIGVTNSTLGQCTESRHDEISRLCLVVHLDTGRLDLSKNLLRYLNVRWKSSKFSHEHRNVKDHKGIVKQFRGRKSNLAFQDVRSTLRSIETYGIVELLHGKCREHKNEIRKEISRILRPLQSIVERDVASWRTIRFQEEIPRSFKSTTPIKTPTMPKSLRRGHSHKAMKLLGDSSNESTNKGT